MRIQQNIVDGVDVVAVASEDSSNYWGDLRAQLSDEILNTLDDWIAKQKRIFGYCSSASIRFFTYLKKGAEKGL
jgi:hypothetical protein